MDETPRKTNEILRSYDLISFAITKHTLDTYTRAE